MFETVHQSDTAIHLSQLRKSFRRFRHPGWRALDALGLPVPSKCYDTFSALRGIDLEIKKGEKVALIGRNGAGKSTLLRVISGQMRPDAGEAIVRGNVQALMELGTGFHPDFTGIDNIRSALAYQGIPVGKMSTFIDEIVDFTELEDFIARPVREYSAGMYARLAFAVATTITPEILIIDEILGAGDAYFVGKSIQRMKQLTSQGATVLFVSHDMSSVQMLCDRAVWIERGAVRADGDTLSVSKAYLGSVREEEEVRARARSMSLTKSQVASNAGRHNIALFRLIGSDGHAPANPFLVASVRYGSGNNVHSVITPESGQGVSRLIADEGVTNWSSVTEVDGYLCRKFADFGGRFVHAPLQVDWAGIGTKDRWIEMDCKSSTSHSILLDRFDDEQSAYVQLAEIPRATGDASWTKLRIAIPEPSVKSTMAEVHEAEDLQILTPDDRYGSGPIKVTAFGFYDESNSRRHTLISGERAAAVLAYSANDTVMDPVAVVAIYRPDGTCATQVTSNRSGVKLGALTGDGRIEAVFDPLFLGPGDYIVSVALFKDLNLASAHEPAAYDLHDRCYTLKVLPPLGLGVEIGIVNQPANWNLL